LGGASTGDYIARVSALNDELNRLQMELRAAEQSRDALKQQLDGEAPIMIPDSPTTQASSATPQLDQRIEAQRSQLDELMRRYTDQHPDVVNTKRLIESLEAERRKEVEERRKAAKEPGKAGPANNPVFQQIKIAISESEANVASLKGRIAETKSRADRLKGAAVRVPEIEAEMAQMNRDYEILRRNYEQLVTRREQASLGQDVEVAGAGAEFRLIDPPRTSPKPVFPDRMALVPLVLLLAVGAGLLASFAVAQIMPTVSDTRALRQIGNRPVLGTVSMLISGPMLRRRRMYHAAFGSAIAGLLVIYGAWIAWIGWTLKS